MIEDYTKSTQSLETIIDFLRFGLTQANQNALYYGHGTDNAWDDMYALILGSLSLPLDIESIFLQSRLTIDEKNMLCRQLRRRIYERVPVPYLTHRAYFCELPFYVDERVLIPRSPIGELIQQHFAPWIEYEAVNRILDLCTGSACIAIACAEAFPDALVDAVDISADALDVAAINREKYGLQGVLSLIESDCFKALPKTQYDIIVSNPPYVGNDEMQTLPVEYQHEPILALEASQNGLAIVDVILHTAASYLSEHGILVVEVGNSEEALMEKYPDVPFTWLDFEHGGHGIFLLTREQLNDYFV